MDNHIFRSALNGFNRQDVMAYIEKTQKESAERVQKMEREIEELRRRCSELEASLATGTEERETLTEQLAEQTELYRQADEELGAQRAEKEQIRTELASCRDELVASERTAGELRGRLEEMEEQVNSAHREKERVAQLELEARQRADSLMEETRATAEKILAETRAEAECIRGGALAAAEEIRRGMEQQVERTAKEYNDMFASFETVAAHVASELRKMDVAAAQLPINFNHLKDGLEEVLRKAKDRSVTEK